MRFGILGPLEVRDEQGVVQLGAAKQRALLGVLLLHVNETVSTSRLIDELWGEQPPATAEKLVQGYVHALRRRLPAARLETAPAGYALRADRESLDLLELRALLEAADRASAGESVDLRRRALALWRGPPLADVALEGIDRHALSSLDELRLTTQLEVIGAELELGRHAQLVGELESLAGRHRYQERVAALLMTALYRSGRQADALRAYREISGRLDDELGLQPGRELRDLEAKILRHDPSLVIAAGATAREPLPESTVAPLRPSRRRVGAAAAVASLAAVIVVAAVLVDRRDAAQLSVPPNSVAVVDPETGRVVGVVEGLIRPGPVAAGAGAIWVGNLDGRTLARIDPETRQVVATIALPGTPDGLAVGRDAVWIAHGRLGLLSRIDPRFDTVVDTIPVAGRAISYVGGSVAVGLGAVWAAYGDSTLARIEVETNRTSTSVLAGIGPSAVVTGFDSVWVANAGEALVRRYSPVTLEEGPIAEFSLGRAPAGLAAGEGAIWVTDADDDIVTRIDPAVGAASSLPIRVGDRPAAVTAGDGAVWVAEIGSGTLSRIDPTRNEVVETIDLGGPPAGLALAGGLVWVSVQAP